MATGTPLTAGTRQRVVYHNSGGRLCFPGEWVIVQAGATSASIVQTGSIDVGIGAVIVLENRTGSPLNVFADGAIAGLSPPYVVPNGVMVIFLPSAEVDSFKVLVTS